MQINCNVDTSLLDKTAQRYTKNLAYSVAQALNDTAKEAQSRIRLSLRQHFHIRKPDFIDRSIKIFVFANVGAVRPYAVLGVDQKQRFILSLFEQGGARVPFVGENEAIPVLGSPARPSVDTSVPSGFTFYALHFRLGATDLSAGGGAATKRGRLRQGKAGTYRFWQGGQRTFILAHSAAQPHGGVFQRTGPKAGDLRLVYSFKPNVHVKAALNFVEQTQQTMNQFFQEAFYRRFLRL